MDKFLLHKMPLAKRGLVKDVSIGGINSSSFNFKEHFEKSKIAEVGRWWVCKKTKPWSIHDVMIIDSGDKFAQSFADLSKKELKEFLILIFNIAEYLQSKKIDKIVIGANINQFRNSCDPESIQRIHIHVCGFDTETLQAMESVEKGELKEASGRDGTIFDDELIGIFKQHFEKEHHRFEYEYTDFDYGYRFEIGTNLAELKTDNFANFIYKLDEVIKTIYQDIRLNPMLKDRFLSYAFSATIDNGRLQMYLSPRSVSGRGVLESLGIILFRDLAKDLTLEQYDLRDRFFNNLTSVISKENK